MIEKTASFIWSSPWALTLAVAGLGMAVLWVRTRLTHHHPASRHPATPAPERAPAPALVYAAAAVRPAEWATDGRMWTATPDERRPLNRPPAPRRRSP